MDTINRKHIAECLREYSNSYDLPEEGNIFIIAAKMLEDDGTFQNCRTCRNKISTPTSIRATKEYRTKYYNCQRPESPCFNRIVNERFCCAYWRCEDA